MIENFNLNDNFSAVGSSSSDTVPQGNMEKRMGGYLDFSKLDVQNVKDLIGKGFHSTCFTCEDHCSIMFVNGTGNTIRTSGTQPGKKHYIREIGIDGVTTGDELVKRILDNTSSNLKTYNGNIIGNVKIIEFLTILC